MVDQSLEFWPHLFRRVLQKMVDFSWLYLLILGLPTDGKCSEEFLGFHFSFFLSDAAELPPAAVGISRIGKVDGAWEKVGWERRSALESRADP